MQTKKLYRGTPAAGALATVYTVANGADGVTAPGGALIKSVIAANVTAADATLNVEIGGVALCTGQVVKANSALVIESGVLDNLVAGDTIKASQGTAAAITLRVMAVTS